MQTLILEIRLVSREPYDEDTVFNLHNGLVMSRGMWSYGMTQRKAFDRESPGFSVEIIPPAESVLTTASPMPQHKKLTPMNTDAVLDLSSRSQPHQCGLARHVRSY